MKLALRFLTNRSLDRLDSGLQRLCEGDPTASRAELRRQAMDCLAAVDPLHQFIERHDKPLGILGFTTFVVTVLAGLAVVGSLGNAQLASAATSGLTAAIGGFLLVTASSLTDRAGSAVALAHDILNSTER